MFDMLTLVDLVVSTAATDKTEPDSSGRGWRTADLLQVIDDFVVGRDNNPAIYALIGRRVLGGIKEKDMIALMWLVVLRGERLFLPLSSGRVERVYHVIEAAKKAISDMSGEPKKSYCLSLLRYHTAIFHNACGSFVEAAEMHRQNAIALGCSSVKPRISWFHRVFCLVKNDLVKGKKWNLLSVRWRKNFKNFRML